MDIDDYLNTLASLSVLSMEVYGNDPTTVPNDQCYWDDEWQQINFMK